MPATGLSVVAYLMVSMASFGCIGAAINHTGGGLINSANQQQMIRFSAELISPTIAHRFEIRTSS